jgi:hypothetical protein
MSGRTSGRPDRGGPAPMPVDRPTGQPTGRTSNRSGCTAPPRCRTRIAATGADSAASPSNPFTADDVGKPAAAPGAAATRVTTPATTISGFVDTGPSAVVGTAAGGVTCGFRLLVESR